MAFLNSVPIPIFRHQLLLAMAVAKQFNKTDMLRKMTRSMLVDWKKREMQKFDTLLWNETISDILRAIAHESRPPQKKSPPSLIIAAEPHGICMQYQCNMLEENSDADDASIAWCVRVGFGTLDSGGDGAPINDEIIALVLNFATNERLLCAIFAMVCMYTYLFACVCVCVFVCIDYKLSWRRLFKNKKANPHSSNTLPPPLTSEWYLKLNATPYLACLQLYQKYSNVNKLC